MFNVEKTKAVIWDLDDTLYSRKDAAYKTFPGMFRELLYTDRSDSFICDAVEFMKSQAKRSNMMHEDAFRALLEKYPSDKPFAYSDCWDYYFENICKFAKPFTEQVDTIKKFRELGIKNAVLTNVGKERTDAQMQKILSLGIEDLFDDIIFSGEIGIHKPDRRIFEYAAERLGVSCEQCVFVGDDPDIDIQGAIDANMDAVWIDNWPYEGRFAEETRVRRVKSVLEYFVF